MIEDFEELPTTRQLLESFELSEYNQLNLDKVGLERQMSLRSHAKEMVEHIKGDDEDLCELVERNLYDILLSCETGRYALMFHAYMTVMYFSTAIKSTWTLWEKHVADIAQNPDSFEDTCSSYVVSVLKAYEEPKDTIVMVLSDTLYYFRDECPDESIAMQLREAGGILLDYATRMLPAVNKLIESSEVN